MKKVKHLPTCIPTALGFHDNNSYPSALPQQGSNRRVMEKGWWTTKETRVLISLCLSPTSQTQMHLRSESSQTVSASGFFLFSLLLSLVGDPLLPPPIRCSVMLPCSLILHHFLQFKSLSYFLNHPCLSSVTLTLLANWSSLITSLLPALPHMLSDSYDFSHLAGLTLPTVSICNSGPEA